MATQNRFQHRVGRELKEWLAVAYESLTGTYRKKPKAHRRVLFSRVEVEQCIDCLHWYPWYELTIDEDAQPLCRTCASRKGLW